MILHTSLVMLTVVAGCSCANIFCIFPTPSFSHQQPVLAISRALAKRGHNLTVITTDPSKVPISNHREIDVSFLYKKWAQSQDEDHTSLQHRISPSSLALTFLPNFVKFLTSTILESPQIKDLIKEVNGTKYDLIIYESLAHTSLLGFADLIGNPPKVGILTMNRYETADLPAGNPITPSYIPNLLMHCEHKMTFFERLYNLWLGMLIYYTSYSLEHHQEALLRKHFGNIPHTARELDYSKSLQIFATDLSTTYPRPLQPNSIYIGPTHIKPAQPLPQDIQKWMDEAEDGVIYFSLGSNMKGTSVSEEKRAAFVKTFAQFPKTRVLWKWESDEELPGQPKNVLLKKWLPQMSVLAHPKLRFFISQVGLQSFQESIHHGVPILGIPMFGDQPVNAGKLLESGAGLVQEYKDISYASVYPKVKELLENNSYKKNMLRLSSITKDKPMSSIDTAIWWIEYVLRHDGAPHLRPSVLDLSWYQYLMLDIIVFIVLFIAFSVYLIYYILRKVILSNIKVNDKVNRRRKQKKT